MTMKVAAIVPAAGKGKRLGSKTPKPFVPVLGKPILAYTLENLRKSFPFSEIILAAHPSWLKKTRDWLRRRSMGDIKVVAGGRTRAQSVRNGLTQVSGDCDWVLVHDAARPLVSRALVRMTLKAAEETGASLCAMPVSATVKQVDTARRTVRGTEDRRCLFLAQTPQVFRKDLLLKRYRRLGARAFRLTDEAALFDGSRVRVRMVPGETRNLKVTSPSDIRLFKFYLRADRRAAGHSG